MDLTLLSPKGDVFDGSHGLGSLICSSPSHSCRRFFHPDHLDPLDTALKCRHQPKPNSSLQIVGTRTEPCSHPLTRTWYNCDPFHAAGQESLPIVSHSELPMAFNTCHWKVKWHLQTNQRRAVLDPKASKS